MSEQTTPASEVQSAQPEQDSDPMDFHLTKPEDRVYKSDESYRFLVHVPLGEVQRRGDEIGAERDGILMTSLVSEAHQGTFCGEGGIIVAQPYPEGVKGIAVRDVGGEIQGGRMDGVDSIVEPAPATEYNQIDLAFDGTRPEGVMIKCTPAGDEIGNAHRNAELRRFAEEHDLPVVTLEVEPQLLPTEDRVEVVQLENGQGEIVEIDIPIDDAGFVRSEVLRIGTENTVYHADGAKSIGRTMKISAYGETTQELGDEDVALVTQRLQELMQSSPDLTQDDVDTILAEIEKQRLVGE